MNIQYAAFLLLLMLASGLHAMHQGSINHIRGDVYNALSKALYDHELQTLKTLFKDGKVSANDTFSEIPLLNLAIHLYVKFADDNRRWLDKSPDLTQRLDDARQIVIFLIHQGASVNAQDKRFGDTPLHEALSSHWERPTDSNIIMPLIELLLKAGTQSDIYNKSGVTARAIVRDKLDYMKRKVRATWVYDIDQRDKEDQETVNALNQIKDLFQSYAMQNKLHQHKKLSPDMHFTFK
jgi:hypothetical protein